jgi:DNA-binding NarL/FixJ family response regulator
MSISVLTVSQVERYASAPGKIRQARAAVGAQMIRVLIVCDQPALRRVLRSRFAAERDLTVVGEAKDAKVAVDLTASLFPDVVLVDIEMPLDDAMMSAVCSICKQTPVLFTDMYDEAQVCRRSCDAGVSPSEARPMLLDTLLAAIRQSVH